MSDPAPTPPGPQSQQEFLRAFLAHREAPCPCCRYSLRDLKSDRCPECSQLLQIQVGLVYPHLASFITGLVGICMGLGFCTLLLGYGLYHDLFSGRRSRVEWSFLLPVLCGTLLSAALLLGWILLRRHLIATSLPAARWSLALLVFALSLLCPLWFIATVR